MELFKDMTLKIEVDWMKEGLKRQGKDATEIEARNCALLLEMWRRTDFDFTDPVNKKLADLAFFVIDRLIDIEEKYAN